MSTTTDIYSHVMPALAREAAERMNSALWGEQAPKKAKKKAGKKPPKEPTTGTAKRSAKKTATKTATRDDEGPYLER